MRFHLLCEGETEKKALPEFIRRMVNQRLNQKVGVKVSNYSGYAEWGKKVVDKAQQLLEGPNSGEILGVIGLLDLYGPNFYPEKEDTKTKRIKWGQDHFEEEVGDSRFKMCFAVHELEAWLLCQPDLFPPSVRPSVQKISANPENVNFKTPPAKKLDALYEKHKLGKYKKVTYGRQLFPKLDPDLAYNKCPNLASMLDWMLERAKEAGIQSVEG